MICGEPRCEFGEGLLITADGDRWWVDILHARLMLCRGGSNAHVFQLPEMASKVLKVDRDIVTLASYSGITLFDTTNDSFSIKYLAPPISWLGTGRSNDACYLPDGSILVGRMDFNPRPGMGDVVRYCEYGSQVVLRDIAIPNTFVYLAKQATVLISDSLAKVTYSCRVPNRLKENLGPTLWRDFSSHAGTPDGGVNLIDGSVLIAMWGAGTVANLGPNGDLRSEIALDALQPTSVQLDHRKRQVVVTTATERMTAELLARYPRSGYICSYSMLEYE